jgi:hypothetical protein
VKPILVLGPEEPGAPSLERGQVDLCRVSPPAEVVAGAGVYDSVIVINDGGAGTLRRVRMALDMRGRGGPVSVGVLTYLVVPLGLDPADPALADCLEMWPQLKVELKEAMLSLEYQAD